MFRLASAALAASIALAGVAGDAKADWRYHGGYYGRGPAPGFYGAPRGYYGRGYYGPRYGGGCGWGCGAAIGLGAAAIVGGLLAAPYVAAPPPVVVAPPPVVYAPPPVYYAPQPQYQGW